MKWLAALAVLVLGTAALVPATAIQVPAAMRVGNVRLPAASCATRDTLWIHHYVAALYVPTQHSPVDALQDPRQPKALQVQILSKTFLPKDMPKKYREALENELDRNAVGAIRDAWHGLAVGDRVIVAYLPGPGVTLQLNDRVVARTPKHEVIDALLKTWAEGQPVPERVNRVVEQHPCQH
ncbi:MAG TPA: chalcone isomerase family protein [Burkholderiales bacterium]|nr:chalcone isomerase family protein [Burkholderiales bacterium]